MVWQHRAIAASPVSPVSTGPVFSSLLTRLMSKISAMARYVKSTRLWHACWQVRQHKMAVKSVESLVQVLPMSPILPTAFRINWETETLTCCNM